ncbi:MAG TPA: cupin domain-containing protein [Spirochaetaceae bacterium]|jgi:quercetin dioxygenase-like cupin family protein|nr:cupin domain-containing protein [Spirochaetaceae bacterium]
MFGKHSDAGFHQPIPGNHIKTLCYGAHTLLVEVRLNKDALLPEHQHSYEQTGYLVAGRIRMFIDGKARELDPGDSWCIPMDVLHKVEVLEDAVVVEVFSPTREEYLKYENPEDIIR